MSSTAGPLKHKKFKSVSGFRELAPLCDALICDVWGVLHDGKAAFPEALACLEKIRKDGEVPVILVSNSPKPNNAMEDQLAGFGIFAGQHFDAVLSAGELARSTAFSREKERCFHLGPERDYPILEGLESVLTNSIEVADYILCTGLLNEDVETAEDYRCLFNQALGRGLPMICANPDLVVHRGTDEIPCAGSLARAYEELGGEVQYFGKPYPDIYRQSLAWITDRLGSVPSLQRVVALGDGLGTDIRGAVTAGLTSLFIASGIHRDAIAGGTGTNEQQILAFFKSQDCQPDWVMDRLLW